MRLNLFSKLALALLAGFFVASPGYSYEPTPQAGYLVQPGDLLTISVWREPDLQRELLVRPDGWFAFPLADEIMAEGRTVAQLRETLTQKLSKFVPDPVVTVSLKQMSGNRVYVVGRVQKPGEFTLVRPLNVMQVLAMAGGLTPYALSEEIKVLRGAGADQVLLPFNYKNVLQGVGLEQNVVVQSGDVILVP